MLRTLLRQMLVAFVVLVLPLAAQVSLGTGSIEGVVTDASGAVVNSARIEVKNVGTGVARSTETDSTGRYALLSLPIGDYEVRAEASGFRPTVRSGITLVIGRTALVDFQLEVGQVTEAITVSDAPPLIESAHAA